MYGLFHVELQRYLETEHGHETWNAILKQAGLERRFYLTVSTYLDSEMEEIVNTASQITGEPVSTLYEGFGAFIAPTLLRLYQPVINPRWGFVEFLLHVEDTVHRVIRMRNPGTHPPRLHVERAGPHELRLHYPSPRRMSAVARGIIQGMARQYGETVALQETPRPDGSVDLIILIEAPSPPANENEAPQR